MKRLLNRNGNQACLFVVFIIFTLLLPDSVEADACDDVPEFAMGVRVGAWSITRPFQPNTELITNTPSSPAAPVTPVHTECHPYIVEAGAAGPHYWVDGVSPNCNMRGLEHAGTVTVDVGQTGCSYDLVPIFGSCRSWKVRLYNPKRDGTVRITASVQAERVLPRYFSGDPCDGSGIVPDNATVTGDIPVQVNPTQPGANGNCSGCAANSGSGNSQSGSAGTATVDNDSVNFAIALGMANARVYAGSLSLYSRIPTNTLAQPSSLVGPVLQPNVTVITNVSGSIVQVLVPEMLVNVAVVDSYQYKLQCFYTNDVGPLSGAGLYTTNAPAFTTWTIENPDGASATNRLWIIEQRDGQARYFKYSYTNQYGRWDLLEPDGMTTISTWQIPDPYDVTITNLYRQVSYDGTIVQKTQMKYKYIPALADKLLIQQVDGDSSTTNSTTYNYYPSSNTDGSANRLERTDFPDGNWTYDQYDSMGRKINEFSAFVNSAPPALGTVPNPLVDHCKQTTYSYTLNSSDDGIDDSGDSNNPWIVRKTVVSVPVLNGGSWGLHEVSRTYNISDSASGTSEIQQCFVPGAHWDSSATPTNLTTITTTYVTSDWTSGLDGLPISITHPDKSTTYFSYDANSTTQSDPDNTQIVTVTDDWGNPLTRTKTDLGTSVTLSREIFNYTNSGYAYDPLRRGHDLIELNGKITQYRYNDCCGYSTITNADGSSTRYDYDLLKRLVASTVYYGGSTGIKTTNRLDGVGRVTQIQRIGTDGSLVTLKQAQYDMLGRIIFDTNGLGGVTATSYGTVDGQSYVTNIYPDGGVRVDVYCRDGRLQSVTGSAIHPVKYNYGVEQDSDGTWREYTQAIKLTLTGGTNEWTKEYFDGAGNLYKTIYSCASGPNAYSQNYYNSYGQRWKDVDPDGVIMMYVYDNSFGFGQGQIRYTINALSTAARAINDYNTLISTLSTLEGGTDAIVRSVQSVVPASGGQPDMVRSDSYQWLDDEADSVGTLVSSYKVSTSGNDTWQIQFANADTFVTKTTGTSYGGSPSRTGTNVTSDGSYTINTYLYGRMTSSVQYDSGDTQIGATVYTYDAHGRQYQVADASGGTTTYGYNSADQVNLVTTPNPKTGVSAETTTTLYDNMLRSSIVTQPDGTIITHVYQLTGELKMQYGSRIYPVAYTYDYAGRIQSMTNWENFSVSSPSGAHVTKWNYDEYRGWLTNKVYSDGKGPLFAYTASGRLASRIWVRGVGTTNSYDNAGRLKSIVYSDSTPSVTNSYDRFGRVSQQKTKDYQLNSTYNLAGLLLTESFSGGPLNGLSVTNGYDQFLRRTNVTALGSALLTRGIYDYDAASRLQTVSDENENSATYSYVANSPLVSQITFKQGATPRMTTTKQYDSLNRLTAISSQPSGAGVPPVSFNYDYNTANQRTQDKLADGSYWVYNYDALGQVIGGHKFFADGTPMPGQQFDYSFDTIGNRTQTKAGGDQTGGSQRVASYTANALNQITVRDYPGTNDVLGAALATNSVTVNGQTAWRKGEYFWSTVKTNNTAGPKWQQVSVSSAGSTAGGMFVPQTPEHFAYDPDGNLTNDGRWSYTWDAENRLTSMVVNTNVGSQYQLTFAYDAKSRRIQKVAVANSVLLSSNKFVYDGWNLVAELKTNNSVVRSYTWGADLSGSIQGAGGVGGLLKMSYYGASTTNCFPAFDGNGNLAAFVNAADGTAVANYEYGPFGEVIRATGSMAKANPMRFSTKYQDDESDLLYFGYRYYKPSTGGWVNRDPYGENGGLNLMSINYNDLINHVDTLGLDITTYQNSLTGVCGALMLNSGYIVYLEGTATWTFTLDNDQCTIAISGPTYSGWVAVPPNHLEGRSRLISHKEICGGHKTVVDTYRLELWLYSGYSWHGLGIEYDQLLKSVTVVNTLHCNQCCASGTKK